jgi:hypothetical protein
MTTETTMSQSREFDTLQEAFNAAAEAAMTSFGLPVSGILYTQGGDPLHSGRTAIHLNRSAHQDTSLPGPSPKRIEERRPSHDQEPAA